MTTEIVQINEAGDVETRTISANVPGTSDTAIVVQDPSDTADASEVASDAWQSFQAKSADFLSNATTYASQFFNSNRRLLVTLGWIVLAFLGVRLVFGALDALDDIPLVSPILKLIGFVYAVSFVWRHMIRKSDRQQLMQQINRTKAEIMGR